MVQAVGIDGLTIAKTRIREDIIISVERLIEWIARISSKSDTAKIWTKQHATLGPCRKTSSKMSNERIENLREEASVKHYQQQGRESWFQLPDVRVLEGKTWHWAKKVATTTKDCWIIHEQGGKPVLFNVNDVDESEVPRLRSKKKSPPSTALPSPILSNNGDNTNPSRTSSVPRRVPPPKAIRLSKSYTVIHRSIPRDGSKNQKKKGGTLQCKWTGKNKGGVFVCVPSSSHQYKETNDEVVAIEDINLLEINPPEARLSAIRDVFLNPQYTNKDELKITIHRHHTINTKKQHAPRKPPMSSKRERPPTKQQNEPPPENPQKVKESHQNMDSSPFETMKRLCFSKECSESECQSVAEPLLRHMQCLERAKSLKVGMWISVWLKLDKLYDIVQVIELPHTSGGSNDDVFSSSELKCKVKYLSDGTEETVNLLDGFQLNTNCNNHETSHNLQPGRALKVWWPAEDPPTYYEGTLESIDYGLLERFHQAKQKVIREGFDVKNKAAIQKDLLAKPYLVHYEDGTREHHNLCYYAHYKLL